MIINLICRWDLRMGQRGQLHRIPLAHNGPVLTLDWTLPSTLPSSSRAKGEPLPASPQASAGWYSNMSFGQFDDLGVSTGGPNGGSSGTDADSTGSGWLASGGMDRCVKVRSSKTSRSYRPSSVLSRFGASVPHLVKLISLASPSTRSIHHSLCDGSYGAPGMNAS